MDGNPVKQREKQRSAPRYKRHRYGRGQSETELYAQRVSAIKATVPHPNILRTSRNLLKQVWKPTDDFYPLRAIATRRE